MEYFCYIIQSETSNKFYIGVSENVSKRLHDHNTGISKWTKNKGPWKFVWFKKFPNLSEARKFENLLKKQKGGAGFYNLTGLKKLAHNPAIAGS